ncbi:hypothetical protein V8C44DRAFT_328574 [Trichoderma aethiopicum]
MHGVQEKGERGQGLDAALSPELIITYPEKNMTTSMSKVAGRNLTAAWGIHFLVMRMRTDVQTSAE